MSCVTDLTGRRFGYLTVLERDENEHSSKAPYWYVQCDCGTIFSVAARSLLSGNTRSCRCGLTMAKDLTGKRFGNLVALRYVKEPGPAKWECKCDCGAVIIASANSLQTGHVKSCGCIQARESIVGKRFGRLVVESEYNKPEWHGYACVCRCDCGNMTEVSAGNLTKGVTKSCGCLNREMTIARNSKYDNGIERRLGYRLDNMKERCYNANYPAYKNYGARGITICDEWLTDSKAFVKWALANGFRDGLSIDRIDNNGPYAPWNCRWVDDKVQMNNTRSNVHLTINGETHTKSEWADKVGISAKRLYKRSTEEATKYLAEVIERRSMPK